MKKLISLPFLLITLSTFTLAQDTTWILVKDTTVIEKKYKIQVETVGHESIKGYLYCISDSSIFVSNHPVNYSPLFRQDSGSREIKLDDLERVSIHRKGKTGKSAAVGALLGGIVGLGAGAIGVGAAETLSSAPGGASSSEKAPVYATSFLVGAGVGALMGALIGSSSKHFMISGSKENLKAFRSYMERMIYDIQTAYHIQR